jgi:hypothetical protein
MVGALAMLVTLTVGTVVALTLVYCVVRYAVRDGIIDARRAEERDSAAPQGSGLAEDQVVLGRRPRTS